MNAYPDASVVAAVLLQEPGWMEVAGATGAAETVHLSDFCYGEVVSSIAIAARRQRFDADMVSNLVIELRNWAAHWDRVTIQAGDIARAIDFVAMIDLALRLPDAIHIAVAERLEATLITTDLQQHRAALLVGVASLNPLESSAS